MASQSSFSEEDFSCSVCRDIFKDPVVLSCSHSFCNACLQQWWTDTPVKICPLCKQTPSLPAHQSLVLKNLCEAFSQQRSQRALAGDDVLCGLHTEKLKLFCLDDQQSVCVVCRDSKKHADHSFSPIGEAALDYREVIQKSLKPLQEKLGVFRKFKVYYDQMAEHIKVQARQTELKIKEQFDKFRCLLKEQDEARIDALRAEEKIKSLTMTVKIEDLSKNIETLSRSIGVIEEKLRAEDVAFLQSYKITMERARREQALRDPRTVSEAPINVTKHLGNLSYNIWDKMKTIVSYNHVILDPNTADPLLMVSDDLTSVTRGQRQLLPVSPEREPYLWNTPYFLNVVLASEGFDSGTHRWDVEVGDAAGWELGVIGSDPMKGRLYIHYSVQCIGGKYKAYSPESGRCTLLPLQYLLRIRVQLDWNRKIVSFFDLEANTLLHTAPLHTTANICTHKLFPFISIHPGSSIPVKLLPEKFSVVST